MNKDQVTQGAMVRHIRTGGIYQITVPAARAKINEKWEEVVIYRAAISGEVFVRETGPFLTNFEYV